MKKLKTLHLEDRSNGSGLAESEVRYRQFFRDTPLPMWIYDLHTLKFIDVNDAAVSHYGYSKEEFLTMTIKDIRPLEEIAGLIRSLEGGQSLKRSGIRKHKKKDGTVIDVEIISHSLNLGHEKNFRLVLSHDVTERLRAQKLVQESLREKEILLKEIHHRVKNNLQVITSLLKLQMHHVDDPKLLYIIKETQNRIMAMSFAHQKLYQSKNFTDVDFSEYLKKIISQIVHIFGTESKNIKVGIDSESVKLGIETVIPCGILINEIITNSVKHAFPDGKKGEIKVCFKKADGDNYLLIVSDNGIGMSDETNLAEAKTLGLQLIETLVRQIDAKLELDTKNGMEYSITFKPVTYKKRV